MGSGLYVALKNDSSKPQFNGIWDAKLQTVSGGSFDLKAFRSKPLLLNFWASWCAPCVEEMPLLDAFYQTNKAKSFQLLGIAADKSESVERFLNKTPVQFPIALAGFDGIALSQSLGNTAGGLPFTALLDPKSQILFTKSGQLTTNDISNITNLMSLANR